MKSTDIRKWLLQSNPDPEAVRHFLNDPDYGKNHLPPDKIEDFNRYELQSRFAERDGNLSVALEDLEHALLIVPCHVPSRIRLGSLHNRMGRILEAKAIYEDLAGFIPNDSILLNNLGAVHFDLGDYIISNQYYKKSIEADPTNYLPVANLAYAYALQGQVQLALLYSEKLVGLAAYGRYGPFVRVARCRAFLASNLVDEAVETLFSAGIEEEANLLFCIHRIHFAERLGIRNASLLIEKAVDTARQAIERNHDPHKTHYRLTLVYLQANRHKDAFASAREALKRGPYRGIVTYAGLYYLDFLGIPESHEVHGLWKDKEKALEREAAAVGGSAG